MPKIIALLAALQFALPPVVHASETLTFAPLPMEAPETVASQWKPLLGYLEKTLGVTTRIDYSENNVEILTKFQAGQLDLAYLGPLPYVTLKKKFPAAEPVVIFNGEDGRPTYTCALAAPAETARSSVPLKGRAIALTQPLSTCGYFATDALLRQAGGSLEENRFRYLHQHDEVALAVVRGEFDAGGLKTAIARKYAKLGLAVVAETAPLPGLALIANRDRLTAERIAQIRQALLDADPATRQSWGDNIRHGVTPARDSDYDELRRLAGHDDIPMQGNF